LVDVEDNEVGDTVEGFFTSFGVDFLRSFFFFDLDFLCLSYSSSES
jgi:hypothetical protein